MLKSSTVMALAGAALLCLGLASAAPASAQSLPVNLSGIDPNSQLEQVMLAGEASAVAQFLGISTTQLQSELVGQSLAQVAQEHGKSVADVTSVVVGAADQQLDAAVSQGEVSSDTAAAYESQISLLAPFLVSSPQASAMALQAATP